MFEVWKKSMGVRNFANFVVYVLIGLLFLNNAMNATSKIMLAQDAEQNMQSVGTSSTLYQGYLEDFEMHAKTIYNSF